jgi:Lrp/AsnC family leucine-responsive transcriptional regulator
MIDEIDRKILSILQMNGRVSNAEVARRVGMAPSAVLERIRKLERKGVIQGYEALVDPKTVGKRLTAFTAVHVSESVGSTDTGARLAEVEGCSRSTTPRARTLPGQGPRRRPRGLQHILQRFGAIPGVRDTRTTIVLATLKESRQLPLTALPEDKE